MQDVFQVVNRLGLNVTLSVSAEVRNEVDIEFWSVPFPAVAVELGQLLLERGDIFGWDMRHKLSESNKHVLYSLFVVDGWGIEFVLEGSHHSRVESLVEDLAGDRGG